MNGRLVLATTTKPVRPGGPRVIRASGVAAVAAIKEVTVEQQRPEHDAAMQAVTPAQIRVARLDLGRELAVWRKAADLTQHDMANRVFCSRSTIANVETGRQKATRWFWRHADQLVKADGLLVKAAAQLEDLAHTYTEQVERAREQESQEHRVRHEPMDEGAVCRCGRTVARWSGRETRALREALRMSVRTFAEYLGVTTATVGCWERSKEPKAPRLSTQDVLDQALNLAQVDARTRFWDLLEGQRAQTT